MKIFLQIILIILILVNLVLAGEVTWEERPITVCPPGIFGLPACQYPSLFDILLKFIDLIMTISPLMLVILIILGGLMYLLSPFNVKKMIESGHRYIQWAIFGYIILLLISLVFTFIRAILGGPEFPQV